MIKVSVLYPAGESKKFDMDYYCKSHMPMVGQKLGSACKSMAVELGLGGGAPGEPPTYAAMGHLYFELDRGVPGRLCAARRGDHGGHSELHRHQAGDPGQRGEDVARTGRRRVIPTPRSRPGCRVVRASSRTLRTPDQTTLRVVADRGEQEEQQPAADHHRGGGCVEHPIQ